MNFQQFEQNQKFVEFEAKLLALEAKLDTKSLSDSLIQNIKSNIDEWLGNTLTVSCIKEEMERRYKRSRQELGDFIKDFKKSEKEVRESSEKMVFLEEEFGKVRSSLSDIMTDVKLKAYSADMNRIERQVDTKCSLNMANELASQLKLMAKADDLNTTRLSITYLKDEIENEFTRKEDISLDLQRLQNRLMDHFDNYSTKEDMKNISLKLHKKHSKVEASIEEIRGSIGSFQEFHDKTNKDIRAEMQLKVGQKELDQATYEISSKVSKQEFSKYISELSPRLTGFQGELGVFNRIIREQEQALLRLDEVLLQKASKVETHDLYQKLALLSKHTDIEYKIDEMIKYQKTIRDDFNEIQADVRQMQLQVSEIQTGYSKKVNDGLEMKFLKDLMLDMQTNISYKVDRTEILNCLEQKAGWGDFSHLSQSLESVHQQIKLLAVQVGAIEKISAPKGKLRNAERSQREYFNKITNRLVNYVVSSKPILDEQPIPEEIKAFLKVPSTPKAYEHKRRISTPHRRTYNSYDFLSNA